MYDLAPGHILQLAHLKRRLHSISRPGQTFIEVGSGSGIYSQALLECGLQGIGVDLNEDSCNLNRNRNREYIDQGKFQVVCGDFFELSDLPPADFLFSSMVIEHMSEELEARYFARCKELLRSENGRIIVLVPSSMKHWGIEDDIAGHFRRYSFDELKNRAASNRLKIADISGLTYPLSNLLLPVSNYLVKRSESEKLKLSMEEQTKLSGNRDVPMKSKFPSIARLALNPVVMFPFDVLQRLFRSSQNSLVIYCEYQSG